MSDQTGAGRRSRAVTAGLSTVGAAAGLAGLAYAGHDVAGALKAGKKIPLRTKALLPLEAVGLGGEVASTKILGGDARQQKQQQQPQGVGKAMEFNSRAGIGRRITGGNAATEAARARREEADPSEVFKAIGPDNNYLRSKGERHAIMRDKGYWGNNALMAAGGATALGGAAHMARTGRVTRGNAGVALAGLGVEIAGSARSSASAHRAANEWRKKSGHQPRNYWSGRVQKPVEKSVATGLKMVARGGRPLSRTSAFGGTPRTGQLKAMRQRALGDLQGALERDTTGEVRSGVRKARRSDSEADRQRRIGYAGGAATGGAIVTGAQAKRHLQFGHGKGVSAATGKTYRSFSVTGGRKGALYAAGSAALTGLAIGAGAHGASERNRTWT